MTQPLVSVVIPTTGRPGSLPRAVGSALAGMQAGEIEVVVVPNGPDASWRESLSQYLDHASVRVLPIAEQHANAARNHGMRHACGKYIRFLDDDDELYPSQAVRQYSILELSGSDICSADIDLLDSHGRIFDEWLQDRRTEDFTESMCSHFRMQQITAHVFRLDAVRDVPWDETLPYSQDVCWLLDIVSRREMKWIRMQAKVGGWYRHVGDRISKHASIQDRRRLLAERLQAVACELVRTGRMNDARRRAIADGVWEQIHEALYLAPAYWWKMRQWVVEFCPGSHLDMWFYENPIVKILPVDPFVWEVLTCPRRMVKHSFRRVRRNLGLARWW